MVRISINISYWLFWLAIVQNFATKNLTFDNQIDSFTHYLAMSRKCQVTMDGCNEHRRDIGKGNLDWIYISVYYMMFIICTSTTGPSFGHHAPIWDSSHDWVHVFWTSTYIWGFCVFIFYFLGVGRYLPCRDMKLHMISRSNTYIHGLFA